MKLLNGWIVSAGLVLTAATAHAQTLAPHENGGSRVVTVSDFSGPYAAMPPDAPLPGYGYGPTLLPPREVYTLVRENGFSPLGIPQARGPFYTIAVLDRRGDDGRLVIDARDGRIVRFVPAGYRTGDNFREGMASTGALPPISDLRGPPRPPASVPMLASRTPGVPMPKAAPSRAGEMKPLAEKPAPEPVQQSAAVQQKPAEMPTSTPAAAPPVVEAKPAAPQIQPTQPMPTVQGLE